MNVWPAPAKLNLFLHVVGRRSDGYHELQTLFQLLDYSDSLRFSLRTDGVITRRGGTGLPADDLTVRAARTLQVFAGVSAGVDIDLEKRIPVGAGLGGGSSDAATVLLALNELWGVNADTSVLAGLGLELGADVPFFLHGCSAWAEGVGDKLTTVSVPPALYCVLLPPVSVSTAAVFADPELTRTTPRIRIPTLFTGDLRNDLETVTCRLYPQVAQSLAWLGQFGDARMTGSGSGLFVAVPDRASGEAILAQAPPGNRGFLSWGIDLHPLRQVEPDGV